MNSVVKVSAQYRESEFTAVTNWTTCRTDDTETLVRIPRGGRSGSREWFSIPRAGNRARERRQWLVGEGKSAKCGNQSREREKCEVD